MVAMSLLFSLLFMFIVVQSSHWEDWQARCSQTRFTFRFPSVHPDRQQQDFSICSVSFLQSCFVGLVRVRSFHHGSTSRRPSSRMLVAAPMLCHNHGSFLAVSNTEGTSNGRKIPVLRQGNLYCFVTFNFREDNATSQLKKKKKKKAVKLYLVRSRQSHSLFMLRSSGSTCFLCGSIRNSVQKKTQNLHHIRCQLFLFGVRCCGTKTMPKLAGYQEKEV